MKVAVSFLKSLYDAKTTITLLDKTSCDYIHVDMMDGKFVKNKTFTMSEGIKLLKSTLKPLDVHLMVLNPTKYLNDYAMLNTEYLTFHYEAVKDVSKVIEEIKNTGLKPGISIKPKTKIAEILPFLAELDQVLVMSVEPGKGGQKFQEKAIKKIQELKKIKDENNYSYIISVDGGIDAELAPLVTEAGADMIVSGSYICMSEDFETNIERLR